MARVTRGKTSHARHKKVLKLAKGYRGRNKSNFRTAIERVEKGLQHLHTWYVSSARLLRAPRLRAFTSHLSGVS